MPTISGTRRPFGCEVYVSYDSGHSEPLKVRLDEVNHSPTGFEWGYGGSGPSQLAYAILRVFYDKNTAMHFYQAFKWGVVAQLPEGSWVLDESQIVEWVENRKDEERA